LPLILIGMDGVIILRALSNGAYAALGVGVLAFVIMANISRLPTTWRSSVVILTTLSAIVVQATRNIWFDPLFSSFLTASGKDSTLTGRTYLWQRAEVLIEQRPWLGQGFQAFWRERNLEPEAIWDAMFVRNRMGFNFHSSIYELEVNLGYVGLALFGTVILFGAARLLIKQIMLEQTVTIFFACIILYDIVRFQFEALPLGIFAHNTLALYGALAHGLMVGSKRSRTAPKPHPDESPFDYHPYR
jgi:exopolysaccharide production protein ExoQ